MPFGNVLYQAEADPRSPLFEVFRCGYAVEALKDLFALICRNTDAVIDDVDVKHLIRIRKLYPDHVRSPGVFRRIVDKVDHREGDGMVVDTRIGDIADNALL